MESGGVYMIQIIPERENPAIALSCGFGQRLLPAPGLNHDVVRERPGCQNLVPADHRLAMLRQNLLNSLVEIGLQLGLFLMPCFLHELLNGGSLVPLPVRTSSPPM